MRIAGGLFMAREYKPYPYQRYAQAAIVENPAIGLFLDMGLGKTVHAVRLAGIEV